MSDQTSDPEVRRGASPAAVRELIGVYHANGSLGGEVSYWFKARFGGAHCALCDITHGAVREKQAWRDCRSGLPVPFTALHLDEQPPAVSALTTGSTPCVVAATDDGLVMLLTTADLERCAGSPAAFIDAIEDAATRSGLALGG